MRLGQKTKFRSIAMGDINSDLELPNLTIITGINGAGKTQLLKAIQGKNIEAYTIIGDAEKPTHQMITNIVFHAAFGLRARDGGTQVTFETLKSHMTQLAATYKNYLNIKKGRPSVKLTEYNAQYLGSSRNGVKVAPLASFDWTIRNIADFFNVGIDDLEDGHFMEYYPLTIDHVEDVFSNLLPLIFKTYHINHFQNEQRAFQKSRGNKIIAPVLTEHEFKERFGPAPWEFFNDALEEFGSEYEIIYPDLTTDPDVPYTMGLRHKIDHKIKIGLQDLSSGESVIVALLIAYYNNSQYGIKPPGLLLLDEIDASLHPSYVKSLLKVLQKTFIEKNKVKIIMTTHNPSTVALSDESSIFVMNKNKTPKLAKADKAGALEKLTEGYVSLTDDASQLHLEYNIEGKDVVLFVEGITDAKILNRAWNALNKDITQQPFYIQSAFGADFMGHMCNGKDSAIFIKCSNVISLFLFDFDNKGYDIWRTLKSYSDVVEGNPEKCLRKKHIEHNSYAMLLPSPDNEKLKKQVLSKDGEYKTLAASAHLTIELMFYGVEEFGDYFKPVTKHGRELIEFTGDKTKFAEKIVNHKDEAIFNRFKPIFDTISIAIKNN